MRAVLFAEADRAGTHPKALRKLLGVSGHRVECRTLDEVHTCDLETCELVLLDGNARGCAAQQRLLDAAQDLRRKAPRVPIIILSAFDPAARRTVARHGCGITASGDGRWHMQCLLKELAWRDSEALLRETLEHEPLEPVTFEYRG